MYHQYIEASRNWHGPTSTLPTYLLERCTSSSKVLTVIRSRVSHRMTYGGWLGSAKCVTVIQREKLHIALEGWMLRSSITEQLSLKSFLCIMQSKQRAVSHIVSQGKHLDTCFPWPRYLRRHLEMHYWEYRRASRSACLETWSLIAVEYSLAKNELCSWYVQYRACAYIHLPLKSPER